MARKPTPIVLDPIPAPPHLSPTAAAVWAAATASKVRTTERLALLRLACESLDRADQARDLIDREGVCVKTGTNMTRAHPALKVERDSRATAAKLLRQLGVDHEPSQLGSLCW